MNVDEPDDTAGDAPNDGGDVNQGDDQRMGSEEGADKEGGDDGADASVPKTAGDDEFDKIDDEEMPELKVPDLAKKVVYERILDDKPDDHDGVIDMAPPDDDGELAEAAVKKLRVQAAAASDPQKGIEVDVVGTQVSKKPVIPATDASLDPQEQHTELHHQSFHLPSSPGQESKFRARDQRYSDGIELGHKLGVQRRKIEEAEAAETAMKKRQDSPMPACLRASGSTALASSSASATTTDPPASNVQETPPDTEMEGSFIMVNARRIRSERIPELPDLDDDGIPEIE